MHPAPWQLWLADKVSMARGQSLDSFSAATGLRPSHARALYQAATRGRLEAIADWDGPERVKAALAAAGWRLRHLEPVVVHESADGQTQKGLFRLGDGFEIESVLMRHRGRRNTVCVSSQAGCAYRCAFCATGQAGFSRHLKPSEIVDQVSYFAHRLLPRGEKVTNVVFMGMGEPFHNYASVQAAVRILCDESGLGLARRHVTISTVGLVPEIRAFASEPLAVNLAISLHAPTDELRSRLMPVNERYPLSELMAACADYAARTGRRIFFEYLMLQGVNDHDVEAHALAVLMRQGDYHVNLIPYNTTPDANLQGTDPERIRAFQAIVERYGVPTTVRQPMGRDISAACGQLRAETQPRAR